MIDSETENDGYYHISISHEVLMNFNFIKFNAKLDSYRMRSIISPLKTWMRSIQQRTS